MKIVHVLLITFILVFASCEKKSEEETPPVTTDPCAGAGLYTLTFTSNGSTFCANASLFADYAAGVMTVNGLNQGGASLTMELDSVTPGTYQIKENTNHFLYTDAIANGFESTDGNPGTLVIISNDQSSNIIKGNFSVTLQSPLTGNVTLNNGNFTLLYTE